MFSGVIGRPLKNFSNNFPPIFGLSRPPEKVKKQGFLFSGVIESPLEDFSNIFLSILSQYSLSIPPENVKKPGAFLCFQGV